MAGADSPSQDGAEQAQPLFSTRHHAGKAWHWPHVRLAMLVEA
jgi:hypothetical protein